jgi:DNA-binding response OmpR family regulator
MIIVAPGCCPTCGQSSSRDWLFDFSGGALWVDGRFIKLTPAEASIVGLLLRADGAHISVPKLIGGVWGVAEPRDAASTLYSQIFILRRKLAGTRLRISHRRGHGYAALFAPTVPLPSN